MILSIIIFLILQQIKASPEFINSLFKNLDGTTINAISDSGSFSYWNELKISTRMLLAIFAFIEVVVELISIVRWIPKFVARQFKKISNRENTKIETIKAVEYKLKNGYKLTNKEAKFMEKYKKVSK